MSILMTICLDTICLDYYNYDASCGHLQAPVALLQIKAMTIT